MDFPGGWALRLGARVAIAWAAIAWAAIACSDERASGVPDAPSADAAATAERSGGGGARDASEAELDAARMGPDVALAKPDAALAGPDAASAATDGAVLDDDCDRDRDGVPRADPECPLAAGLEPDCDDGDARKFPGAPVVCRDTHFAGCSRDQLLADSLGLPEVRMATIDLGSAAVSMDLSSTAAGSRLFGPAAGLIAHSDPAGELHITSVPETLVDGRPGESRSIPWVEMVDMQKVQVLAAVLGRAGNDAVFAVVDRRPSARLFSLAGIPTHELVAASAPAELRPVAGILDLESEPTLVTAATDAMGVTHLSFTSASAQREVAVDTAPDQWPWLAVGRDRVLWGAEGSSFVEIVEASAGALTRRTLTANVTGSGALVAERFGSDHFVFVPTMAGLESFREPCAADACQPVAHPAFAAALGLRPRIAVAEAARSSDLVALTIVDSVQRTAHLYFIHASDPGRVLFDLELHGPGDAQVRDVAISATERYGGLFLLVTTLYWSQREMQATGVTLCELL